MSMLPVYQSKVCALLTAGVLLLTATFVEAAPSPTHKAREARKARKARKAPPRRIRHEPPHRKVLRALRAAKGSVSLGNTSTGRLIRGTPLSMKGKHHAVLPRWRKRRTNYGTDELLTLLLHGAREVARAYPGSRMMLGNLSLRAGGDIRWSHSHNAGRDGDIAFYLRRGRRQVAPAALVKVGARLRTLRPRGLRFDLRRNWALIKALLTHRTISVQWIFIAKHLKAALLRQARQQRASATLVARADKILRQPTDSLSHDDHFHVRIFCSREDRLQGCQDRPPFWPGVKTWDAALRRRIRILERGLADGEADLRLQCLAQLVRLQSRQSAATVARRCLQDPDARVRRAALTALLGWRNRDRAVISALSRLIRRPGGGVLLPGPGKARPPRARAVRTDAIRTGRQLRMAYDVLAALASRQTVGLLRQGLRSKRRIAGPRGRWTPEALLAASAARSVLDLRLVPALLDALEHPRPRVRRVAAQSLRRLTNHDYHLRWGRRLSRRRLKQWAGRWRRWWRKHRHQSREDLVRRGFRRVNRRLRNLKTRRAQWVLVSYTRRADHLGFNAHRMLRVLSGQRWRTPTVTHYGRRYQRWRRWYRRKWRRRRRRLRRPRRRRLRRIKRKRR